MYSLSGFGNTFWFISNQVDDPTFLLAGFEQNATCPDSKKNQITYLFTKVSFFWESNRGHLVKVVPCPKKQASNW